MSDDFNTWAMGRLLASGQITPEQAEILMQSIEPPPEDNKGTALQKLIADKKLGKGLVVISKHPQNIFLNLKQLFMGSGATAAGIASAGTLAGPFLGLVAVVQFLDAMSIELSQDHAQVVLWLWDKRHGKDWVDKADLESEVASKLKQLTVKQVLDDLVKIRAIEIQDNRFIWKTEYLVIKSSVGD